MEYTSAGVILINMNSKVLIVQYPEGHWGFPKGYKETEDKSLVDTAKRELKEENATYAELADYYKVSLSGFKRFIRENIPNLPSRRKKKNDTE